MTRDETPHYMSQSECQIQHRKITPKAQEHINSHTKAEIPGLLQTFHQQP